MPTVLHLSSNNSRISSPLLSISSSTGSVPDMQDEDDDGYNIPHAHTRDLTLYHSDDDDLEEDDDDDKTPNKSKGHWTKEVK